VTTKAPEILFDNHGETVVIALPELLEYTVDETVLTQRPIAPAQPTTFIFPGVILKTPDQAYYVPVGDLTLFEAAGSRGGLSFTQAGTSYSIPQSELDGFTGLTPVLAREPLAASSAQPVTVFPGSLLRDTEGRLYYLPPGAFANLTSFAAALGAGSAA
jgi:hypothetical protein